MIMFVYYKKRRHISVPPHLPVEKFVEASLLQNSSEVEANVRDLDLPDYFAAVKYTPEVSSSSKAGRGTEDAAGHVCLPPSYEQALKMTASAASVSKADTYYKQGNTEDARLT